MWLKLYTWLVLSRLLFPRAVYGAAWELQRYVNDVYGMSHYTWAEAVMRCMVYSFHDMQRRLCNPVLHIQFNGFFLFIQVQVLIFFVISNSGGWQCHVLLCVVPGGGG